MDSPPDPESPAAKDPASSAQQSGVTHAEVLLPLTNRTADAGRLRSPADGAAASPLMTDGTLQKLDPRSIPAERVSWWILLGCVVPGIVVGVLIVWLVGVPAPWTWLSAAAGLALTLLLVWLSRRMPEWVYARTRYAVSEIGIEIHRGLLWREIVNVPRSRVQHTDVTQGPIAQRYGIATLTIHTAGTEDASVELSGLAHETALRVRDHLLRGGPRDGV